MITILVSGSRTFTNYESFKSIMNYNIDKICEDIGLGEDIRLIFGDACGTDTMAKQYAIENGYHWARYIAHWKDFGKMAGRLRNQLMVNSMPDRCIFFWDGKSPGTRDCLDKAKKAGLNYVVYYVVVDSNLIKEEM